MKESLRSSGLNKCKVRKDRARKRRSRQESKECHDHKDVNAFIIREQ